MQTSTNFLVNQIYSLYQQSSDVASNVDETFVDCYARIQSVLAGSSGFDNASTGSLDQSANDVSVMFLANSICHEGAYSFPTYPSAAAPASSNFTFTLTRSSLGILFLFYFERKFFYFFIFNVSIFKSWIGLEPQLVRERLRPVPSRLDHPSLPQHQLLLCPFHRHQRGHVLFRRAPH